MFVKTAVTFSALILASLAVGVVNAQAPALSQECKACLSVNFVKIPECLASAKDPQLPSGEMTPGEKKCVCAWSKLPSSTWSQGCISDTLCSQQAVDAFAAAGPLLCAADAGVKNSAAGSGMTLCDVKSAKVITGLVTAAAFALL
ncbi:hypothetical protein BGZ83_005101 [Gryganskiella cystojenkinii]|nr:hypothetical protein BGZ83_005101 [Gryganskiella cystojenkinii]